MFMHFCRILI